MKTLLLMSAIASSFALTMAEPAQARGGDRERPAFSELDANSDGEVSQEELVTFRTAKAAERFEAADINGDGALSAEEIAARGEREASERSTRRANKMIERLDANEDGLLQQAEITVRMNSNDRMTERFTGADTDGSGGLSEAEMEEMKGDRGGRGGKRGGKRGDSN